MQIHGLNKLTLLDYPGHMAATIFTGGCNFRCPFCHNSTLVLDPSSQPAIPEAEVLELLKKRRGVLEGVCITGGEPTLSHDLPDFIARVRELGYLVKLDSNGSNAEMLEALIKDGQLDYIAMDIKSSREDYGRACGSDNICMRTIERSVELIRNSGLEYEFRTTVVDELHSEDTFRAIGEWLNGSQAYYLQNFEDSGQLITQGLHAAPREKLLAYKDLVKPYFDYVEVRGIQ